MGVQRYQRPRTGGGGGRGRPRPRRTMPAGDRGGNADLTLVGGAKPAPNRMRAAADSGTGLVPHE